MKNNIPGLAKPSTRQSQKGKEKEKEKEKI